MQPHQYIDSASGKVITEKLFADPVVNFLYSDIREKTPSLFKALTRPWVSSALGFLNYESRLGSRLSGNNRLLRECKVDLSECLDPPETLDTPRKIFERRIRYWETRPLPDEVRTVVSPADSRVLVGSLRETSALWLKDKFFQYSELIGADKSNWLAKFKNGDFSIFRLTPDKYHFNHCPVSGRVLDFYEISGDYHSCNPGAVVHLATPYSKNKRTVTVIDTDVPRGSGIGLVAMIEVVALMIGDILQCYSGKRYDAPQGIKQGMFLKKGQPKSLFRPGSSTTVLIFQNNKVQFSPEIIANMQHPFAQSRFSLNFKTPLVETDIKARSSVAQATDKLR